MHSPAELQSGNDKSRASIHLQGDTARLPNNAAPIRLRVAIQQKRYAAKAVLGKIEFDVRAGEIIAVLGASGCGKSTLLRAIAGLDQDWRGAIEIHAANPHRVPIVGVVYQEPRLMPWLTVEENIAFALVTAQPDAGRDQTHTNEASDQIKNPSIDGLLQAVYLENARHCLPKQLSGGMAQRVAIARALVRAPDVLLLDEPFSALDILTRRRLIRLTREVTARFQTATVLVTHDPDEAVRLADRVVVLAHSLAEPPDAAGATICADIRPSLDPADKFREVEGIIATLHQHKQAAYR